METFQAASPDELPSEAELKAKVDKIAVDLKALRAAPVAEPYAGPAMLSGRAAAVFFHEVLGHRLEGHRQRGDTEGQTARTALKNSQLTCSATSPLYARRYTRTQSRRSAGSAMNM